MEILWGQAIAAGLVATGLMTLAMIAGRVMGLETNMVRVLGLAFTSEQHRTQMYIIGTVAHFGFGAVFGIIYALLLTAIGAAPILGAAAAYGAMIGGVHGLFVGAGLGALPAVHPRMGSGQVLSAPGFFGRDIGVGFPVAVILLHIVYGVTAGVVYSVGVIS